VNIRQYRVIQILRGNTSAPTIGVTKVEKLLRRELFKAG